MLYMCNVKYMHSHVSYFKFFAAKALGTTMCRACANRIIHEANEIASSLEFWHILPNWGWPSSSPFWKVWYDPKLTNVNNIEIVNSISPQKETRFYIYCARLQWRLWLLMPGDTCSFRRCVPGVGQHRCWCWQVKATWSRSSRASSVQLGPSC